MEILKPVIDALIFGTWEYLKGLPAKLIHNWRIIIIIIASLIVIATTPFKSVRRTLRKLVNFLLNLF